MFLQPHEQKEASMKQNIVYVGLDVDDTQYHGYQMKKAQA